MDVITNLWADWWWPFRIVLDLLLITVFVRGVIANEILEFLKSKGLLKQGLLKTFSGWVSRKAVIWQHYAENHNGSVLICSDSQCASL